MERAYQLDAITISTVSDIFSYELNESRNALFVLLPKWRFGLHSAGNCFSHSRSLAGDCVGTPGRILQSRTIVPFASSDVSRFNVLRIMRQVLQLDACQPLQLDDAVRETTSAAGPLTPIPHPTLPLFTLLLCACNAAYAWFTWVLFTFGSLQWLLLLLLLLCAWPCWRVIVIASARPKPKHVSSSWETKISKNKTNILPEPDPLTRPITVGPVISLFWWLGALAPFVLS